MFRILNKYLNRKGQNTAEYALLISLVVAAIIAMQTYAQRALQARIKDASQYMVNGTSGLGTTDQYEPYYLQTNYEITRDSTTNDKLGTNQVAMDQSSNRTRAKGGSQVQLYNVFNETVGH